MVERAIEGLMLHATKMSPTDFALMIEDAVQFIESPAKSSAAEAGDRAKGHLEDPAAEAGPAAGEGEGVEDGDGISPSMRAKILGKVPRSAPPGSARGKKSG